MICSTLPSDPCDATELWPGFPTPATLLRAQSQHLSPSGACGLCLPYCQRLFFPQKHLLASPFYFSGSSSPPRSWYLSFAICSPRIFNPGQFNFDNFLQWNCPYNACFHSQPRGRLFLEASWTSPSGQRWPLPQPLPGAPWHCVYHSPSVMSLLSVSCFLPPAPASDCSPQGLVSYSFISDLNSLNVD